MGLSVSNLLQAIVPSNWFSGGQGSALSQPSADARFNPVTSLLNSLYNSLTRSSAPAKQLTASVALHRQVHPLSVRSALDSGEQEVGHLRGTQVEMNGKAILRDPKPFAEGGFSKVYHGFAQVFGNVVIKAFQIPKGREASPDVRGEIRASAEHEMRVVAHLNAQGIQGVPRAHGLGMDAETSLPILVMQQIDGEPLSLRIKPSHAKSLTTSERLRIARDLIAIVVAAEKVGVIHRDLKCENVMLTPDGRVFVVDWGSAQRVESGSVVKPPELSFTPLFRPPNNLGTDAQNNIYNLGMTLYQLLADEGAPIRSANGRTIVETVPLTANGSDVPLKIDDFICKGMLAYQPEERPSLEAVVETFAPSRIFRIFSWLNFRQAA